MAKKSFIIHIDSLAVFDDLDDAQQLELWRAICAYNSGNEVKLSGLMKAVFTPFKNQFDREHAKSRTGKHHWNWQHGKSSENVHERNCTQYKDWRVAVFQRDFYTCQYCKVKGGRLNAHHILTFAKHPELRFEVSNGLTLCERCHRIAHKKRK